MRNLELEQAWKQLILFEGVNIRTEKEQVVRLDAAKRMHAGLGASYELKHLNKDLVTKEDFMKMYCLKKNKFRLEDLHGNMLRLLNICNPCGYDNEKDFQNDFCEILGNCYIEESEVRTLPLFNQNGVQQKYWSLDIVLNIKQYYIPIELKFRKDDQSKAGYADDFKEDAQRIKALLDIYDDMPQGYAIILTNKSDLLNECKSKISELKCIHYKNSIFDTHNVSTYVIGMVALNKETICNRTNKSFLPFWENKHEKE